MAELKCPHCGQAFTVDDTELSSIVQQIRDKEFEKDIEKRISELKDHMMMTHRLEMEAKENEIKLMSQKEYDKEIQKLKSQLEKVTDRAVQLQAQLDSSEDKKTIAVMEAVKKVEEEKKELESQLTHEKDKGKLLLEQKDEQIAYYRDLKTKMSTKMVGETLEQHCEIQFNQLRATAFRNAYFEKDNDSRSGSKGDYIYRETDENGVIKDNVNVAVGEPVYGTDAKTLNPSMPESAASGDSGTKLTYKDEDTVAAVSFLNESRRTANMRCLFQCLKVTMSCLMQESLMFLINMKRCMS